MACVQVSPTQVMPVGEVRGDDFGRHIPFSLFFRQYNLNPMLSFSSRFLCAAVVVGESVCHCLGVCTLM